MLRLGIFGGTFDPPHLGHLILSAEAKYQLKLDKVLWVLTPLPPHKKDQHLASLDDRIAMVNASIKDDDAFEFSFVDINRLPPYYSVDTVNLLKAEYPDDSIIFLIGADSLQNLPNWKKARSLISVCDEIGVMFRPDADFDFSSLYTQLPDIYDKLRLIKAPMIEISSRTIRRRINTGGHFRYFLKDEVYQIIVQRGLYKEERRDLSPSEEG